MVVIGVLALQGDFLEHIQLLSEIPGTTAKAVKSAEDLSSIDALIIPGGESTTIGRLITYKGLDVGIKDFVISGRPLMGVCAGAIIIAKKVIDRVVGETKQPLLNLMNIKVLRNAFGRQKDSFETEVEVEGIGNMRAVFIRGPAILEAWNDAKIVGFVNHPDVGRVGAVAVEKNLIAVAFHPELTGDVRLYKYLVGEARR
ncbi:MAG: pyridoxal 5'-phosphate synthase glutaminase subunit PdxT [Sulfolobales archaeon]